jgi:hypothetical protein
MPMGSMGRWLAAPVLLVGTVVASASGCATLGTGGTNGVCDQDLQARAQALEGAVEDLVTVAGNRKAQLAVACAAMAKDLGMSPPSVGDGTMVSDDTLTSVCNMASMAIKAKIAATGHIVPVIQGGRCVVDAQAQFTCEQMCDVSGMCMAPTIEARCNKGDLSGECDGTCMAGAYCEGSATVAAQCQGTCDAQCVGKCMGNCVGTCDGTASMTTCAGTCTGTCSASCTGTCSGNCKLDANAMVMCGAMASCRGGCSVAYKQPTCEGTLTPPSCKLNAECEAGCSGQGTLKATCTPPTVDILIGMDASLKTTLTTNLPAVVNVAKQGALVAMAVQQVSTAAQNVVTEVGNSVGCAVVVGADFATKIQASVTAAASINVSVMATVTITGAVAS